MVVLQPIKPGPPRVSLSLKRGRARRALSLLGNNNTQKNLQLAESLLTISAEEFAHKWNFDVNAGVPLSHGRFQWTPLTPVTSLPPVTSSEPVATPSVSTTSATSRVGDLASSSSPDLPPHHPAEDKGQVQKTCINIPPSSSTRQPAGQVTVAQSTTITVSDPQNSKKKTEVSGDSESRTQACNCQAEKGQSKAGDTPEVKEVRVRMDSTDSGVESDESLSDGGNSSTPTSDNEDATTTQELKLRQPRITEFVRPKKLSSFKPSEPQSSHSSYPKKRPASSLQDQLSQPPHKKVLLHLRA